jgi:hypothetical protein
MKMITKPFILISRDLAGFKNLPGLTLRVCLSIIALAFTYNVSQAQVKADTLWAEGRILTNK